MIIKNVELETVCGITSKLPDNQLCEIAFAGKSNVGKSSLINGLVNRKALARTSSQPGKTQTINFYNVNGVQQKKAPEKTVSNPVQTAPKPAFKAEAYTSAYTFSFHLL